MSRSDDNYFSYNPLNRASEKRKDIEWLKEKIVDEKSVYVLFSDLQPVVTPTEKVLKAYIIIELSELYMLDALKLYL